MLDDREMNRKWGGIEKILLQINGILRIGNNHRLWSGYGGGLWFLQGGAGFP
ncbi:hypothetical protein IV417_06915 [Alphaproteobacteria bacterium KMM 3653]|uniref:Uncharacterized protein n=1 Tax=Harenicola maris TaxID=2841044 RepID=A0AAP2CP15_9RHOB|nr:hypothetical protein [Harenicola maris]